VRTLPDPAPLDDLTDAERSSLVTLWAGRAQAELQVSDGFRRVAEALRAARAEPQLIEIADRAVKDEERHAQLCHHAACAFAEAELPSPTPLRAPFPDFSSARPELIPTLYVVTLSCFSETTGSAFLEACLREAGDPMVRALLRELLTDDIDHARIGWAHLHSRRLSDDCRVALADWIAPITRANLATWRRRPAVPPSAALAMRGCPAWEVVDRAVLVAIRDLIFPGFERAGYRLEPVRTWFEEHVSC
jgi:hypothetical protein